MSGSVGALLSRRFLVPVLAAGFFLAVSLAVSGAVGAQQSERMYASWYGPGFEGATTASGEPFDPYGYTAAHKTLPFGTMLEVCYQGCVVVRVNDRGPFIAGRDLDLAQGAADAIGLTAAGHAWVDVTYTSGAAGPSSGGAPPQAEPAGAAPQATQQPAVETADSAADEQYAVEEQYAVDEQYVAEEQYAVDEQYAVAEQYEPRRATPPPAPAPPAPAPAALEVAPLELATPGSTVERRIQLAQAAPPENYTGPLPEDPPVETSSAGQEAPDARKPQSGSVAAIAGMTVLPDTGGLPLAPLAGAALILMVVGVIRR